MLAILWTGCRQEAKAQQVVQLSGLVTSGDSVTAAAGVAVFVPHTSRGTQTNKSGFFSLPVLPGDSVVIAALGYERHYILIPKDFTTQSYSATIVLQQSSIALPTVDVMPWATERDLKVAISKVKLPKEAKQEVDLQVAKSDISRTGYAMDAKSVGKYVQQQQHRQMQSRYMVPPDIKLASIPISKLLRLPKRKSK